MKVAINMSKPKPKKTTKPKAAAKPKKAVSPKTTLTLNSSGKATVGVKMGNVKLTQDIKKKK